LQSKNRDMPTIFVGLITCRRLERFHQKLITTTRTASCNCGQLRAEVTGEPVRFSVCHCDECQRRTGSVFAVQARFPREAVHLKGEGTEFVRTNDEGAKCRFTFCSTCGSTVFYVEERREEHIAIPVGGFADPTFPSPTVSVYEESSHPWVAMPAEMVRRLQA